MDTLRQGEFYRTLKKSECDHFAPIHIATRLITAGARTATIHGDGADGRDDGRQIFTQAEISDLHLTLSRSLLLLGASGEADGHARAAERLSATKNVSATTEQNTGGGEEMTGSGDGETYRLQQLGDDATADAAALRLEIALLSHTPVVLETVEKAVSLRRSLLLQLQHLTKAESGFSGSISSPLEVGLRAQFLATYQVTISWWRRWP